MLSKRDNSETMKTKVPETSPFLTYCFHWVPSKMDRLFPELLSMILSQIGFEERARLRLVNKFWMNVIDRIKVNRLVLIDENRCVFN